MAMSEEEVMMAVTESRLSPEEKKKFVEAKRKSLVPWCENDAWRPVKRTQAPIGTIVPMRFLCATRRTSPMLESFFKDSSIEMWYKEEARH